MPCRHGCAALNEAHHKPGQLIGILALQALASRQQGKVEDALAALERALTLAQPGGLVWPFVELGPAMATLLRRLGKDRKDRSHIDSLLAAFPNAFGFPPGFSSHRDVAFPTKTTQDVMNTGKVGDAYLVDTKSEPAETGKRMLAKPAS